MRPLLSIKWKLVLTVVGVSLLSLGGLMLLTRRQAERYMLEGSLKLLQEASVIEASRYNQAAENISTLLASVQSNLIAEMDRPDPDTSRIAGFMQNTLENASGYFKSVGLVTMPGVLPADPESSRYVDGEGRTAIEFSTSSGRVSMRDPDGQRDIMAMPWWNEAVSSGRGLISEPHLDEHAVAPGQVERHAETRFVQPVFRNGKFIAMIWGEMGLDAFQKTLREFDSVARNQVLVSPGGTTVGFVDIDVSGLVASSGNGLSHLVPDGNRDLLDAISNNRGFTGTLTLGENGTPVQVASAPIIRDDIVKYWSVILFQPESEAMAESSHTLSRQLYQGLGLLLVSGLLGCLAAHLMGKTLVASDKWHQSILDRIPLPLGILDTNSDWVYVNPVLAGLFTAESGDSFIGRNCADTLPPGEAGFLAATNTSEAADIESREIVVGDGRVHSVSSRRLLDDDGRYVGRLLVGVDITDSREVARTLDLASSIALSLDGKSESILNAAHAMSESAMQKSAAIEEITSTTQKIGEASATYAASAKNSHSQAEATHQASDRGASEALGAAAAMNGVRDSGHKIRKIIKLIDDIAFQTNLLALNAAVEAARAGRNGKGFAVVADEVRNLAQRSARAARETSAMIEEMTGRIGEATDSIEQLGSTLIEIKENAEYLRSNSDEVARLADQQSHSVYQVHISLEQISKSVSSTIIISRETANVAEALFQQAADLRLLTRRDGDTAAEPAPGSGRRGGTDWLLSDRGSALLPFSSEDRT